MISGPCTVASPCSRETFLSVPPIGVPETVCPREKVVDEVVERVKSYRFIVVRGTPATGKMILIQLVDNRLLETLGKKHAIYALTGWAKREVGVGGWNRYLELRTGVRGYSWLAHPTYLLLDEAQEPHSDSELWAAFFKSIKRFGS